MVCELCKYKFFMKTEFKNRYMLKLLRHMSRENLICWFVILGLFLLASIMSILLIAKIVVNHLTITTTIPQG